MISIPARLNARWIAALADEQLVSAEAQLYGDFRTHEIAERSRSGARYVLLEGSPALVTAWHQWVVVHNATCARGLRVERGGERLASSTRPTRP